MRTKQKDALKFYSMFYLTVSGSGAEDERL
jgi:hypothetical protein